MSWQRHRELYWWEGGNLAGRGSPLAWDFPRLTPNTLGRAYLENSQDKRKLAPEVFVYESTTPLAFFQLVLGLLGGASVG